MSDTCSPRSTAVFVNLGSSVSHAKSSGFFFSLLNKPFKIFYHKNRNVQRVKECLWSFFSGVRKIELAVQQTSPCAINFLLLRANLLGRGKSFLLKLQFSDLIPSVWELSRSSVRFVFLLFIYSFAFLFLTWRCLPMFVNFTVPGIQFMLSTL